MKARIFILFLFTIIPAMVYCQEIPPKDDKFHFIEAGTGASYTRHVHGAVNVALSNSLGRNVANFIDYNLAFGKSDKLFQEINFKLGPYYQFGKYSFIAVSSGISLIHNSNPISEKSYDNFYHYYFYTYSEPDDLINIPIQFKLNIGLYKGGCIGFKGTLNKMMDKGVEDKGTMLMYVALGF